jgi:ABC-2 type transport system permease protein
VRTQDRPSGRPAEERTQLRTGPSTTLDLRGAASIWQRELIRFFRERSRAITSLVQPLLYLLVFGTGLGATGVRIQGVDDYRVFLLPGTIVMTVLFTSMFSGMSIVWDREFGFLKEILVAPVSRPAVIAGKVTGGATTACMQGLAILIFAPLIGMDLSLVGVLKVIPTLILFALAVNLLGVAVASRTQTMQAFMVIQNFVMLPLFFLSGAVYPLNQAPGWLRAAASLDPATYAVDAIRRSLIPSVPPARFFGDAPLTIPMDMAVLAILGAILFVFAVRGLNRQP